MSFCVHCDEIILIPVFNKVDIKEENAFCCIGCLTVYNVIHNMGYDKYYEIKRQSALFKKRSPAENKFQQFSYIDNQDFLNNYSYIGENQLRTMEFYIEGIHCLACLWLIEKMPEYLYDVVHCRLDMKRSVATVTLKTNGLFGNVAREFKNLGYKPHPLKKNQNIYNFKKKEERVMLLKIGIAGAASGNIMLYAISNYAGADEKFSSIFNFLSVLFALPVLLYSATPFYKNAWNAIKNFTLSIDIPISIALIIGAFYGIYNQTNGVNENFFDSLTALVFLLLLSRYFLNKIQEEGLTVNDLNFHYEGNSVLKKSGNQFIEIHPQHLNPGDIIKVLTSEMFPADGIIIEGETLINNSLLTGESKPINISLNDQVFSGTINLSNDVLVKVENVREESRIGKILKKVESGWLQKSPIIDLTNRISKYFIASVFLFSAILFVTFFLQGKTRLAFERSLTLLIVTCPCALALATPMTLTRSLSKARMIGIIIKNNEVIEKLASIKTIFLDKTGTLTYGILKINHIKILKESDYPIWDIISSLEKYSSHPVAIALKEFSLEQGVQTIHTVNNYKELIGTGVSGEIGNRYYEIKNGNIFEDKICIAQFFLQDQIRQDSKESLVALEDLGLTVKMLSGDHQSISESTGQILGLKKENIFFEMTPEKKLLMIEKNFDTLMVGDGANDAMALSRAYVSVAVLGSLDISLKASDIFLTTPGISHLANLITISRETMKVIKRNLILSLIYNSISVYAAFTGIISPLVAAIIMPLSSLTVLVSTLIGTPKLNSCFKKGEI